MTLLEHGIARELERVEKLIMSDDEIGKYRDEIHSREIYYEYLKKKEEEIVKARKEELEEIKSYRAINRKHKEMSAEKTFLKKKLKKVKEMSEMFSDDFFVENLKKELIARNDFIGENKYVPLSAGKISLVEELNSHETNKDTLEFLLSFGTHTIIHIKDIRYLYKSITNNVKSDTRNDTLDFILGRYYRRDTKEKVEAYFSQKTKKK